MTYDEVMKALEEQNYVFDNSDAILRACQGHIARLEYDLKDCQGQRDVLLQIVKDQRRDIKRLKNHLPVKGD